MSKVELLESRFAATNQAETVCHFVEIETVESIVAGLILEHFLMGCMETFSDVSARVQKILSYTITGGYYYRFFLTIEMNCIVLNSICTKNRLCSVYTRTHIRIIL